MNENFRLKFNQDNETNVTDDYKEGDNAFTGTIYRITIDVKPFTLSDKDKKEIEDEDDAAAIEED